MHEGMQGNVKRRVCKGNVKGCIEILVGANALEGYDMTGARTGNKYICKYA